MLLSKYPGHLLARPHPQQRRLSENTKGWLGHVRRKKDGRIPKDTQYGELATGIRPTGSTVLRFKDVCKDDMKTGSINSPTIVVGGLLSGNASARVRGGDGRSGSRKGNVRSRWQKQPLSQLRRSSNAATVTESVAQGSDCTVTAATVATRTDTLWAPSPTHCLSRQKGLTRCCSIFFTEVNFKIKGQLYGFIRHLAIKGTLSV